MSKITLLDGTEYAVNLCGAADGVLQIDIADATDIAALALEFGNPDNVRTITETTAEGSETEYVGYTHLSGLLVGAWSNGSTLVSLKQEVE